MQLAVPRDLVQRYARRQLFGGNPAGLVVERDQVVAFAVHQQCGYWITRQADVHPASIEIPGQGRVAGQLADRGVAANSGVRAAIETKLTPADVKVVKFIDDIKDELGEAPAPPPKGAGAIQEIVKRYTSEVLFNRLSTEDAGKKAVDEMTSAISG